MSNKSFPSTRAIQLLRSNGIEFTPHHYRYLSDGNVAKDAAAALNVSESEIYKTLVFWRETGPLLVLIDAAHRVGQHKLSNVLGERGRVCECSVRDAERYTGYKVAVLALSARADQCLRI